MIVSPGSRARENRKSDWPWRKRAEQKPHAEFSVGRSSIIGAWYRPVIPLPTRQARVGRQVHLLSMCVCVCAFPYYVTAIVPAQATSGLSRLQVFRGPQGPPC